MPKLPSQNSLQDQWQEGADLWKDLLPQDEYVATNTSERRNISPPPSPIKDRRENPHGIVDIITFCEHPYFLNQKLYPWQILSLKGFYCGQDGNRHLSIDETTSETGCDGCVWKYNKDSEIEHVQKIIERRNGKNIIVKQPNMLIGNSPCLECERFDFEIREIRYESILEDTADVDLINEIKLLKLRNTVDRFENEMDMLKHPGIKSEFREQFLDKVKAKKRFSELVMVMGRRSGKSYLVAIIALYEVYKFIMMGWPQGLYPIMEFDIISIVNVAVSERQALQAIFAKILELVKPSPFFAKHLGKETQSELHFLTPHDLEENERRSKIGITPLTGTIQLMSGHSNSAALVGRTMACIIIDEHAALGQNGGDESGADYALYDMLKPSLATFGRDGKLVSLSNPLGEEGKFFELYNSSFTTPSVLMIQLPTELSNPNIDKVFLENEKKANPTTYNMHYGAEFGRSGNEPFLPAEAVERAFDLRKREGRVEHGAPLIKYFAHLDPAGTGSDNYALIVLHTEPISNSFVSEGVPSMRVVVDHINIWDPVSRNNPANVNEIDSYILNLAGKFKFVQVSYDQWNSQESVAKLIRSGINAVQTPFTMHYQDLIFINLRDLLMQERVSFYGQNTQIRIDGVDKNIKDATRLRDELLGLQQKWRGKHFKVEAISGGRDDITDCLASAAWQALSAKSFGGALPRSRVARLGGIFR